MMKDCIESRFSAIRKNVDQQSNQTLDFAVSVILAKGGFIDKPINHTKKHLEHFNAYLTEKHSGNYQQYKHISELNPEIFYFHHGLRFADKKILDYIKTRIMD